MSTIKYFFKCFYSPSLYMTYHEHNNSGRYSPDKWEKVGDISLSTASLCWRVGLYWSPLVAAVLYRRSYLTPEGLVSLSRLSLGAVLLISASLCLRSYARATNPAYRAFLDKLSQADSPRGVAEIKCFDFDFNAWPVEFYLPIRSCGSGVWKGSDGSWLGSLLQSPCALIGYLVLRTFGISLIYPGSTALINFILGETLMEGRRMLILEKNGVRYKLKTPEGNSVDSMVMDRRRTTSTNGRGAVLVVCCEGNAGFYENGIMTTALESGFSVLGWNHPGFGASTGTPYLREEQSAINTVMEFAIQRLGFPPEDIILYGWSIGGYPSAWAAAAYPTVRALVLDASFDDLLPLALNAMPTLLEPVVRATIRCHANLDVARLAADYPGHLRIVRRTDDEVISIVPGDLSTNRGNYLLVSVLRRRYPGLLVEELLAAWLATTGAERRKLEEVWSVSEEECRSMLERWSGDGGAGELSHGLRERLTLYLGGQYMRDVASTHCIPLPSTVFLDLVNSTL